MTYVLSHNAMPVFVSEEQVEVEVRAVGSVLRRDLDGADVTDEHELITAWSDTGKLFVINDERDDETPPQTFTGYEVREVVSAEPA